MIVFQNVTCASNEVCVSVTSKQCSDVSIASTCSNYYFYRCVSQYLPYLPCQLIRA